MLRYAVGASFYAKDDLCRTPTDSQGSTAMLRNRNIALVTAARFVARVGGEAAFFIGVWGLAAYRFRATPTQLAAYTVVSRVLLNLDETITKE